MNALVIERPGVAVVRDVPDPVAGPGEVVVRVHRAGVCGTDRELLEGTLVARPADGAESSPRIPGHEWVGVVETVGDGVDAGMIGVRVIGDTFVACAREGCALCADGRVPLCPGHREVGVKGLDGGLAERVRVPAANAVPVPDSLSDAEAALVEPLSNVVRAFSELPRGTTSVLVRGAGSLGLLAARVAAHRGIDAVVVDPDADAARRASAYGVEVRRSVPEGLRVDAVLDLAPVADMAPALTAVRDGGVVVVCGFPAAQAMLPVRQLVERDIRVIGTLGAPSFLREAMAVAHAIRAGDIAGAPVPLARVAAILGGEADAPASKVHTNPRERADAPGQGAPRPSPRHGPRLERRR